MENDGAYDCLIHYFFYLLQQRTLLIVQLILIKDEIAEANLEICKKMRRKKIVVDDKMQRNYVYYLTQPIGRNFDSDFKPELSPRELLSLGIFGGKYMCDCQDEFPASWFKNAKLAGLYKDPTLNYFKVDASLPLQEWKKKGWLHPDDPRGWFQWYCRYYMGRRMPREDSRQIKRWRAVRRHIGAIQKHCKRGDICCRPRQRQALLHWAYDSRKL